jgi:GNAT superfamily N-acetyltransferase
MNPADLLLAIESNEAECLATFECLPSAGVQRTPQFTRVWTRQPFWLFNGYFKIRLEANSAEKEIAKWRESFEQDRIPFGVFCHPASLPSSLPELLLEHGFKRESELAVVVFDSDHLMAIKNLELPKGFEVQGVRSADQYQIFFDGFSSVFGLPRSLGEFWKSWGQAYGFGEDLPLQNIMILKDGKAVAMAMYFLHAGVAGIYGVGVVPQFRNQGLGTFIAKAIADGARARGVRYLAGTGSDEGMQVYRKAKIEEIGKAQRWKLEA